MPDETISDQENADEEYEVITSEEVDRVLDALEELTNSVESENIKVLLEEAADTIYSLIYEEEDDTQNQAVSEAA